MNLPPTEEVAALLAGEKASGVCTNVARIAVPPLSVLGDEKQQWMGEAAAELIASRLSHSEGTSVLERGELKQLIEEIERSRGEASDAVVSKGKLLGARMLVTGKLFPASGDTYKGVIKAVDTETGVWLPAVEFDVPKATWTSAVSEAAGKLSKNLGTKASATAPPPSLSAEANELAAKALKLQQEGKLLEAQPLYAQALPKPTSAWRYEAEYLTLMNDLGLKASVADRADRVLAAMPVNSETACDRARILTERYRLEDQGEVNGMRKALRVAASCGDPNVIARTLQRYSWHMKKVHSPSADAAIAKAESLLDSVGDVAECAIRFEVLFNASEHNLQPTGEEPWRAVAKLCEEAGDLRSASVAYRNAGHYATGSTQSLSLRRKALEVAQQVGGQKLDDAFVSLASELRDQGAPTDADQQLLSAMSRRLKQLIALHGGLPDPAARLDADLLKRTDVLGSSASSKSLAPDEKLLSDAYHASLGILLKAWAKRTRPESKTQADVYDALAAQMDPGGEHVAEESDPEAKFVKRLQKAGLALAELKAGAAAPLRGGDQRLDAACQILWDWYWHLNAAGPAQQPKQAQLVGALKTAAGWLERPHWQLNAMRLEARYLADSGKAAEAAALMDSAVLRAAKNSSILYWTLGDQIYVEDKANPQDAQQARKRRIEVAERYKHRDHVDALYEFSYASIGKDQAAVELGEAELLKAVARFKRAKEYENAAYALQRLALLDRYAEHADGTENSVLFMAERARVIDRLGDPQRSLEAQADSLKEVSDLYYQRFRGGAGRQLDQSPNVSRVVQLIGDQVRKAASEGRAREAVRIVARLPENISAVEGLAEQAIEWTKSFEDSAEHPLLVGKLYLKLSGLTRSAAQSLAYRKKAGEAFLKGEDYSNTLWSLRLALPNSSSAEEFRSLLAQCRALEKKHPHGPAYCATGALGYLDASSPRDVVQEVFFLGKSRLASVDEAYIPTARIDYRARLVVAAVLAGDTAYAQQLVDYVRNYYTRVAPNAYMLVTFYARVGNALKKADPSFATELYLAFDRANGASDYWKATEYFSFANTARLAKNREAEKMFLEKGTRYAQSHRAALYHYDMYPAIAAWEKQDWKAMDKLYEDATKRFRERFPGSEVFAAKLDRERAIVKAFRKQNLSALKLLEPHIKRIESGAPTKLGRMPCQDTRTLQTAAGIALAAGQCKRAEELQALAATRKQQCTKDTCYPAPGTTGMFCDRVEYGEFKPKNECRKPMADGAGYLYH